MGRGVTSVLGNWAFLGFKWVKSSVRIHQLFFFPSLMVGEAKEGLLPRNITSIPTTPRMISTIPDTSSPVMVASRSRKMFLGGMFAP